MSFRIFRRHAWAMAVQKLQRCEVEIFSLSRCTFWDPESIKPPPAGSRSHTRHLPWDQIRTTVPRGFRSNGRTWQRCPLLNGSLALFPGAVISTTVATRTPSSVLHMDQRAFLDWHTPLPLALFLRAATRIWRPSRWNIIFFFRHLLRAKFVRCTHMGRSWTRALSDYLTLDEA